MSKRKPKLSALPEQGNSTKPLLQDGFMQFNVNHEIYVKLTEKGIEKYVKDHNNIMLFKFHISYREFEERKNEQGYHKFQLWSFIDHFGGLGMSGWEYYNTDVLFNAKDLEAVL